jgi:hypothetical protein
MFDLTEIISAVIALAVALITAFLIPWMKTKLSASQQEKLVFWLQVAVQSAEEYFRGPGRGEEKAAYVREFLQDKGYDLDDKVITALIDSTVWQLINRFKEGAA